MDKIVNEKSYWGEIITKSKNIFSDEKPINKKFKNQSIN